VIGVVADPELASDDRRHPLGGPDLPTEAERFGAAGQEERQLLPLLIGQFRGRTRRHPAFQRLDPALAGPSHPLADGPSRHPEGVGNRLLAPVLLLQLPGPQSPPFSPVPGRLLFCAHTQNCRTSRATFSNRHGDQ
jgi:hypothetical protein